jgi:hypothetical protein
MNDQPNEARECRAVEGRKVNIERLSEKSGEEDNAFLFIYFFV